MKRTLRSTLVVETSQASPCAEVFPRISTVLLIAIDVPSEAQSLIVQDPLSRTAEGLLILTLVAGIV
ncbi:MAG: hypothetical protein WCL18_09180 [bacterium]